MIDDGERIAVTVVAEEELSLVVDRHQVVRFKRLATHAQRMCGRRTALAWLHQVRAVKDVAGRTWRRPLDVGMKLRESSNDLPRSHMWESATKGDDLLGHLVTRSMRNVLRCPRPIDESLHPVAVVSGQPFMQLLTAHAETIGEFSDRVEAGEIGLDESLSFAHRTGDLPWHDTPSLPEDQCHPCSRSVLSPMCPVCTHAEAVAARLRPGSRTACLIASVTASRRLQFATRFFERHRRQPPRRSSFGHAGPAAQLTPRTLARRKNPMVTRPSGSVFIASTDT
jgi:hypothetical protein